MAQVEEYVIGNIVILRNGSVLQDSEGYAQKFPNHDAAVQGLKDQIEKERGMGLRPCCTDQNIIVRVLEVIPPEGCMCAS